MYLGLHCYEEIADKKIKDSVKLSNTSLHNNFLITVWLKNNWHCLSIKLEKICEKSSFELPLKEIFYFQHNNKQLLTLKVIEKMMQKVVDRQIEWRKLTDPGD